ncbi:uncharacterized protein LOC130713487 [Lotus japonicus]|uniref:uncharacterized protein LOC130713487 n=1 Tax=Lotus japonicus TaxID=34305 RepID=UPI002587B4E2|nr:uncharacterized protein LOC130713487 [Lotus japonicus]
MNRKKSLQIFIQSPDLHQIRHESVTGDQTLADLKRSLFPESNHRSSFYFTLHGKPLPDDTPLSIPQIAPLSTLVLQSRLRGGGGDGGATGAESRDCYLKMYSEKKPDKVDPNEQRLSKWQNCALSNEPLREPCVIDKLGNIFNKEALVEALLGKKLPKEFGYIKGLKDMITIRLSSVPRAEDGAKFQCPISGLELNGKYRFFALRNCGHVLSAKALKEVRSSSCLVCHEDYGEEDKVVINGNEDEVAALRERMEMEKTRVREGKKNKKVKGESLEGSRLSGTKHVMAAVEKASAKVEVNGKVSNGGGAAKRFKAIDVAPAHATKEVYASIFTSSRKSDFKETYSCRSLPLGRN